MTELRRSLDEVLDSFVRVEARRDSALRSVLDLEDSIQDLEVEVEVLDRVCDLFRTLIDREVLDNVQSTERLLTEGLNAVFEDMDLSVRSEIDIQRGKVSVDLVTRQIHPDGSITEGSVLDAYGGALAAVESVLLRITIITRRGLRPLVLLDESLAAVSEHYVTQVGRFLSILCARMGFDILAVTHNPALVEASDRSYRISLREGEARFKPLRTGG